MNDRTALVTGASGVIGSLVVPALLAKGWQVKVLTRSRDRLDPAWRDQVSVVEGDAGDAAAVRDALAGVDVAYYLVHSMAGHSDYSSRDRQIVQTFADIAATSPTLRRIVYLSGLHPGGVELSEHMASRVETGEILLGTGVPTAVLQAGVVLGAGSASFEMLRHLTERLPAMIGPKWLRNRIQPIDIADAVHYLVAAAELPPEVSRSFDIGMDEVLQYAEMIQRYAGVAGLRRRPIMAVPVLTPRLASHWVGLVTPVPSSVAKPLVGSLIHEAVRGDDDLDKWLPEPPGGTTSFDEAVLRALDEVDPRRWQRSLARVAVQVATAAVAGALLTDSRSAWYRRLRKPAWQPPAAVFPIVWNALYAGITIAGASTIADLGEQDRDEQAAGFGRALAANLLLNAAWSGVFFRLRSPALATAVAAMLSASGADLARRAAGVGRGKAAMLGAYAAWCAFASVLSLAIATGQRADRSLPRLPGGSWSTGHRPHRN